MPIYVSSSSPLLLKCYRKIIIITLIILHYYTTLFFTINPPFIYKKSKFRFVLKQEQRKIFRYFRKIFPVFAILIFFRPYRPFWLLRPLFLSFLTPEGASGAAVLRSERDPSALPLSSVCHRSGSAALRPS